jgi:hypothetical protein
MKKTKAINICKECGEVIDLRAQTWYTKRNPEGFPRRCSPCTLDALLEMVEDLDNHPICHRDMN